MIAEIINIGTELLLGYTIDTNSAYISQKLSSIGIDTYFRTTVGDNKKRLTSALKLACERSDIVITVGGLGPTIDDITSKTIADFTKKKLAFNKNVLKNVHLHFKKRNITIPKCNKNQAYVPEGTMVIKNDVGTAPGIILNHEDKIIIALPGPPPELMPMIDNKVITYLKKQSKTKYTIQSKTIRIVGLPESKVNEKISDLLKLKPPTTVGIYAHPYKIDLKITSKTSSKQLAFKRIKKIENIIGKRLGSFVYGTDNETLEEVIGKLLLKTKRTIAIAESCTGGLLSNRITDIPGSSEYFKMGIITYSNKAKIEQLDIPETLIKKYGAVSKQVAKSMANNVKTKANSDIGIGITGIAGPAGSTKTKPIGLVYIAVSYCDKTSYKKLNFTGSRKTIKQKSSDAALDMVRRLCLKL